MSGPSPAYISSHSADVILSDIRPLKLKVDALLAVNAFLDEFLHRILQVANSFSTDKLRHGLLKVLPTSLGKELVLEAEVELRAYWDRTGPLPASVKNFDDNKFRLQWAFELLRLKCEAYSTLNDAVQDADAELRLTDRLAQNAEKPPAALVAPAALYLTAILEAICEHILSNVGRVASRDSSRMHATGQDLFIALCEDDAIYALFKSMSVYAQVEGMSTASKPRRSKSLSRSEKLTSSQTDLHDSASPRNRLSSDSASGTIAASLPRTSSDKSRTKKLFHGSSRSSHDDNSHKRSESVLSDETKQSWVGSVDPQDPALQQEFDDLMRSDATMKVSLTPDRLKTMEMYKQEKNQRGNRKPPPMSPLRGKSEPDSSSSAPARSSPRRPSLRHVDSIIEDDEELTSPSIKRPSPLRNKASFPNTTPPPTNISLRTRASSTSSPMITQPLPRTLSSPQARGVPPSFSAPSNGLPQKTRKKQRNRESLDLDDIMAGSDNDLEEEHMPLSPKTPLTPRQSKASYSVSSSTKELLDFLEEGPPHASPPVSKASRELMQFLAEGPPLDPTIPDAMPTSDAGRKGSGRLQRMISKLSLSADKTKNIDDISRQATPRPVVPMPIATKPVPPRPRPISPPPSPPAVSFEEIDDSARSRRASVPRKPLPIEDTPEVPVPVPVKKRKDSMSSARLGVNGTSSSQKTLLTNDNTEHKLSTEVQNNVPNAKTGAAVNHSDTSNSPSLTVSDAHAIRRMLTTATNADECRIIFDMFLAKTGIGFGPFDHVNAEFQNPYPSSSLSVDTNPHVNINQSLEHSIVELLLCGEDQTDSTTQKGHTESTDSVASLASPEQTMTPTLSSTRPVRLRPVKTVLNGINGQPPASTTSEQQSLPNGTFTTHIS